MSDDIKDDKNDGTNETPQKKYEGKKRGRKPSPVVLDSENDVDARYEQIMSEIAIQVASKPRTIEEIIEHNKILMTKIQDILMADLQTIAMRNNLARIKTPNGIQKFEIAGLPQTTRDYLRQLYKECNATLFLANVESGKGLSESEGEKKKYDKLADALFKGVPGLKIK